jgi:hypothetical protein
MLGGLGGQMAPFKPFQLQAFLALINFGGNKNEKINDWNYDGYAYGTCSCCYGY